MNISSHTLKECAMEFKQILIELEHLVQKCAVHKKKFEFAVSQFRRFIAIFSQSPNLNQEINEKQLGAIRDTMDQLSKLYQLLCLHQLDGWENSILEDPSEYVADALCSISQELHNSTIELNKEASSSFIINRIKWIPLHILDIKCIKVSFNKYIESHSNGCNSDPSITKMKARLNSINKFIDEYNDKNLLKMISPGVRVFSPIPINSQSWRIQYSDLNLVNRIGEGSSCDVYSGFYKKTGKAVAIKKLKFNELNGSKHKTFQREVGILAKTSHPCLLNFVGATDTYPFCIVTDWMPNGTLFDELHSKKQLDPTMRTIALFDIARGMQYLHSKHIVHRDLKSLNVLIDEKYHACICDFGFSKDTTEGELITRNVGTPFWMAPELSTKNTSNIYSMSNLTCYTPKIDVYSYGIILWETSSGLFPRTNELSRGAMSYQQPSLPLTTPEGVKELYEKCCDLQPENRPSFDEIVHTFMTGKVLLNGADEKRFMNYVKETIDPQKVGTVEDKINKGIKNEKDIAELIQALLKEGFPEDSSIDLIEKCWTAITRLIPKKILKSLPDHQYHSMTMKPSFSLNEKGVSTFELNEHSSDDNNDDNDFDDFGPVAIVFSKDDNSNKFIDTKSKIILTNDEKAKIALACKVIPLFLQTSLKSNASSLLRALPAGSIPDKIIAKIAEMIPSGSEDFDDDIAIAACKNGASDVVAVYSISPEHLKLAFEVVAKEGVSIQLKTAVSDKCIQCLNIQRQSLMRAKSTPILQSQDQKRTEKSENSDNNENDDNNKNDSDNNSNDNDTININDINGNTNTNNDNNELNKNSDFENEYSINSSIDSKSAVIIGPDSETNIQKLSRCSSASVNSNVSSASSVDLRLTFDNIDKQSLNELACAAIRCIVGIGEVRRLSPTTIVKYLSCDFAEIRNCFYSVLCALALHDLDEEMPIEVSDIMIDNITRKGDSLFAENAMTALAKIAPKIAEDFLTKFLYKEWLRKEAERRYEMIVRMMMVMSISKNSEFKHIIRKTIDELGFKDASSEIKKSVNTLKAYAES